MDLLDFEAIDLYYDKEDSEDVQTLINQAGNNYENGAAELPLLKAYLRAPESLNVLVAINRFYYYQHRLEEALLISEKAINIIIARLDFPTDWRQLSMQHITDAPKEQLSWVRLYLFTLKSIGFLKLRMLELDESREIFEKLVSVDTENRIGGQALLDLVRNSQAEVRRNQFSVA